MNFYLPSAIVLFTSLVVGCGEKDGYAELGLIEVTGTVTLDGKPLPQAKVNFESDDKRVATGVTDAAGHYVLMYDSKTRGVLPGTKTVRITTANTDVEGGGAAEGTAVGKEILPPRYNTKSDLKIVVSAAQKTLRTARFDFELRSAP